MCVLALLFSVFTVSRHKVPAHEPLLQFLSQRLQPYQHFLLVLLLRLKMKLLNLHNVFKQVCVSATLPAIHKEDRLFDSRGHYDIHLLEMLHCYHVPHEIAKFAPGLRLLKSNFAEPFAQK